MNIVVQILDLFSKLSSLSLSFLNLILTIFCRVCRHKCKYFKIVNTKCLL